jgi:hypothetical protein
MTLLERIGAWFVRREVLSEAEQSLRYSARIGGQYRFAVTLCGEADGRGDTVKRILANE